jgi:hypothetical protein
MPHVIVGEIYETVLEVGSLEPHFKNPIGDGRVLQECFSTVLLYSGLATLAAAYFDFGNIGSAALEMVAGGRGLTLSDTDRNGMLQSMWTLPALPDVRDDLQIMRDAGLRLVTLTNNPPESVKQLLTTRVWPRRSTDRFRSTPCGVSSLPLTPTTPSPTRSGYPAIKLRMVAVHA